jgi:release factor glutamine methyltransferase
LSVGFVHADLLDGGVYDVVLANLPYVADRAGDELAAEIRLYEPAEALFAGDDGLDVIRRLAGQLGGAGGESVKLAAIEVAPDQATAVADLLRCAGFRPLDALRDLAGHERVVVARR